MATPLKLEVLLAAVDNATAPLNRIEKSSTKAGLALKELRAQQRQLNQIQQNVTGYRKANVELTRNIRRIGSLNAKIKQQQESLAQARTVQAQNTASARTARNEYRRLSEQYTQTRTVTRGMSDELERARMRMESTAQAADQARRNTSRFNQEVNRSRQLEERLTNRNSSLARNIEIYGQRLKEADVDMSRLRLTTQSITAREDALTASITKQKRQLDQLRIAQDRVNEARASYQRGMNNRTQTAVTGASGIAIAEGVRRVLDAPIKESERYQNETARIDGLGQGQQTTQEALNYSHTHQAYGVSQRDTLTIMRDALSIFGSTAHAEVVAPILQQMQFANRARYGEEQGEDNERIFMDMLKAIELRGGANDPAEFKRQANMIQQIINATGGRVNADEWLQVIKTGGIAVKGLSDGAFYYKLEPLIQEMGGQRVGTGLMSAYQNLYQGRTTKANAANLLKLGLIGDKSKIKYDAVGQQAYVGPGALKDGDLFRRDMFGWVDKVLIPQLHKAGINSKQGIMDAVGSILTNRTGAAVISGYVMQRESNDRRARLNEQADGIDAMTAKARQQAQGKEIQLSARLHDLYLTMGNTILPTYSKAIDLVTSAIESLNGWMERNPRTARAMIVALAGFGVLVGVLGAVALAAAAIMGPLLMARLGVRLLGLQMAETATSGSLLSKALSIASLPIRGTGAAAKGALTPVRALGQGIKTAFLTTVTSVRHPIRGMRRLTRAIGASSRAAIRASRNTATAARNVAAIGLERTLTGLSLIVRNPIASVKTGLTGVLGWIRGFFPILGRALIVGMRALVPEALGATLANPLTWGVAALAAAAIAIYRYWEPIKAFFAGVWDGLTSGIQSVSNAFGPAIQAWQQALAPLAPLWNGIIAVVSTAWRWFTNLLTPINSTKGSLAGVTSEGRTVGGVLARITNTLIQLIAKLAEFGASVTTHLVGAITSVVSGIESAINTAIGWIKKAAGLMPSWAAKSLGIATIASAAAMPQMGMAGQDTSGHHGNDQQTSLVVPGQDNRRNTPQVENQSAPIVVSQPPLKFDSLPPIQSQGNTRTATDNRQYIFQIHAAPGMDPQAVAAAVRIELDRRDSEHRARGRASLHDKG